MADKFTTLITLLIIALVAFYAFQNYYKPTAGQFGPQIENNSISNRSLGLQTYSRSWPIPGTNLTFQHNISFANGQRVDFVGYQATGAVNVKDLVNRSILVIVPKQLAANASRVKITPKRGVEILREDPGFLLRYGEDNFECRYADPEGNCLIFARNAYALEFTDYGKCPEEVDVCPPPIFIPLPPDVSLLREVLPGGGESLFGPAVALRERLDQYADLFRDLSQQEADEVSASLTAILNNEEGDTRTPARIYEASIFLQNYAEAHYENEEIREEEAREVNQTPRELVMNVSEFSPKVRESFILPRNLQAVGEPVVAVRGLASNYRITASVEGTILTVEVDLSDIRYAGGLFSFSEISGDIELLYTQTGYRSSLPLTITVNHVYDATLISPRALPSGVGGEFMFIVPNLQRPIEQVVLQGSRETCGVGDSIVDIPAADPANPKAVVLYMPQEVKTALIQHGECYFVDQRGGVVPNSQITLSTTLTRTSESQSLMPFIANLDALRPNQRWNECSEAYCGCTAGRQALESAIAKTKADARRFYGPGYTLYDGKFWRFYLFNLAAVEGCNFGAVPLQDAAPGKIQVVAIGINPANPQQVTAKSFHGANNFQPISAVPGVTPEEIKQAVLSPWLCFDPNGLPQSLPEDSCSAEQRRGQAIARR